MINGLINVYKERGFTSMDVCACMRGISGQRKVGHTGTLDPDAEGVLPVCLGNATKLCDMLTDKEKEYVATFVLGKKTDTLDIWGNLIDEKEPVASTEDIIESVNSFVGGYEQLPPMFSAKKINGQRLYDLARKGRDVERKPVWVEINAIEVLEIDYPNVTIRVNCGKGTYIRSLIEDIGSKCGEYACMTSLKRTKVSEFAIEDALTLDELTALKHEGRLLEIVKPTEFAFMEYPGLYVKEEYRKFIDNGNKLMDFHFENGEMHIDGGIYRVYNNDRRFAGLYKYFEEEDAYKPYKMFLEAQ